MEIHSEPSKGTQFVIRLPLSLSIIYAVLFRLGKYVLAIPTSQVEGIEKADFKPLDEDAQLCDLRSLLRIDPDKGGKGHIIRMRQVVNPSAPPFN